MVVTVLLADLSIHGVVAPNTHKVCVFLLRAANPPLAAPSPGQLPVGLRSKRILTFYAQHTYR